MTPHELIEVARAMRKLGASRLEVRADGMTVEFADEVKAPRKAKKAASAAQVEMPDPIERMPKLTFEQVEKLYEQALDQYVPGN